MYENRYNSGALEQGGAGYIARAKTAYIASGALSLGFDEASWIPTALNMAMMFSGIFVVFLNVPYGPRRILLPAAAIFTVASALLPLATTF